MNANHVALLRLATRAALGVALTLALAKAIAWWLSGSVSLLAGLTDSLLDGAASFLNLLAVNYALRPADDDHRFGHGKAEALAGLGQSLLISLSAVLVAYQALQQLHTPEPIAAHALGIAVMIGSIALTFALLVLQNHVVKATGSTAIRADSLHYRSDLLLNSSILLALVLSQFGFKQADGLFGLGISAYILWSAYTIVREATAILMDQEPEHISRQVSAIALKAANVMAVRDVRTRLSAGQYFVQLNILLPKEMSLKDAHDRCEWIELSIKKALVRAEVMVHAEPYDEP